VSRSVDTTNISTTNSTTMFCFKPKSGLKYSTDRGIQFLH
jgi:hypothetical protein